MRFWLTIAALVVIAFLCVRSCGSKLLGGGKDKQESKPVVSVSGLTPEKQSDPTAPAADEDPPMSSFFYRFENRAVPEAATLAPLFNSGKSNVSGSVVADKAANTLLGRCAESEIPGVLAALKSLDVLGDECYCDAWMFFVSGDKLQEFEASLTYREGIEPLGLLSASNSGFGVVVPAGALALKFDFLKSSGLLEVLDRPQLRLSSGETAEVSTGEDVPFPVITLQTTGQSTTGIEWKRVGLTFKVTPLFLPGNRVRLAVNAENGLVGALQKIGDAEVPSITRQNVSASATLGFDDAIILGGLESIRKERRFGLLGESEKRRVGRLYVALVLRSGFPRAIVPKVGKPGEFELPGPFDDSLLPPKGWTLDGLNQEIDRVERDIKLRMGRPVH